jgi:hypothetical protein
MLVVFAETTVDDLIAGLLLHGFFPHDTIHSLYEATLWFRQLAGTNHMSGLGAGSLTNFHLRSHLLGGSGIQTHVIYLVPLLIGLQQPTLTAVKHQGPIQGGILW